MHTYSHVWHLKGKASNLKTHLEPKLVILSSKGIKWPNPGKQNMLGWSPFKVSLGFGIY